MSIDIETGNPPAMASDGPIGGAPKIQSIFVASSTLAFALAHLSSLARAWPFLSRPVVMDAN